MGRVAAQNRKANGEVRKMEEEEIPLRRTTRLRSKQIQVKKETEVTVNDGNSEAKDLKPEKELVEESKPVQAEAVRKSQRKIPKPDVSTNEIVTRKKKVNYNENDEAIVENEHLYDCCFIRVRGEVYSRWKEVKKLLKISADEKLVLHFLDDFELSKRKIVKDETALDTTPKETLESKDVKSTDVDNSKHRQKNVILSKRKNIRKRKEASLKENFRNESEGEAEESPVDKIIKRKKLSSFDCRKTPSDGMVSQHSVEGKGSPLDERDSGSDSSGPLPVQEPDEAWCRHCDCRHIEGRLKECPVLRPTFVVTDAVIDFSATKDDSERLNESSAVAQPTRKDLSKSFAQLSLPSVLELVQKFDSEDSSTSVLVVTARFPIKAYTQFGPLQGESISIREIAEDFEMKYLWQIFKGSKDYSFISTHNTEKSNWFRYVRPAPCRRARNVATVIKGEQLHLVTLKDLERGEEILYWIDDPDFSWSKARSEKKNCGGCNIKFAHPLYYRMHSYLFHDPAFSLTIRKFHCKICGIAVLGKENIVKHAASQHGGRGAYQCQFCKKYFLRLNYLEMHRNYGCASNPSRSRPVCKICGKKFCQPQKLRVHMKRVHSDENSDSLSEFQCPICQKVLATRHAVMRHRKEVHSDLTDESEHSGTNTATVDSESLPDPDLKQCLSTSLQKILCPKCPKTFKNKSNLKIHMLTHSGVKPFGCKIEGCKTGFTTKQCLQFHYRKSHGLADEEMPKIEREIPYTLSAYSGGILDNKITAGNKRLSFRSGDFRSKSKQDLNDESTDDVYTFKEGDEPEVKDKSKPDPDDDVIEKTDLLPKHPTSFLVAVALSAAEQDLKASSLSDESACPDELAKKPESPAESKTDQETPPEPDSRDHMDEISEPSFPPGSYDPPESSDHDRRVSSAEAGVPPQSSPTEVVPIVQPELPQSHSSYDGYVRSSNSPFVRRSPTFQGSGLFQNNVSPPMMHQREAAGAYVQHPAATPFPYGPTPPSAGPLYHPGLEIASRYSSHFRGPPSEYPAPPLPYGRNSAPFSDFGISEPFYETPAGSIDLSSHGAGSSGSPGSSPSVTTSSPIFSHHSMMISEHLHSINSRETTSPGNEVLSPFTRLSKPQERYHQGYYPPPHPGNPPGRFPPPGGYHHPPGTRLPHFGQAGPPPPPPYHYGYF